MGMGVAGLCRLLLHSVYVYTKYTKALDDQDVWRLG